MGRSAVGRVPPNRRTRTLSLAVLVLGNGFIVHHELIRRDHRKEEVDMLGSHWRTAHRTLLGEVLLLLALGPHALGCSDSGGDAAAADRAEIEAALQRYAEALDWPRGTGWEEGFNPVAPSTWPVDQWQEGYDLFRSLFADDAVLDYESLCMRIEVALPPETIEFLDRSDPSCPVLGFRIKGSLDFFYYGITLGTQFESETTITPTTIDISGNTASSEDSYVHTAVLNHYLLNLPPPQTDTQEGVHRGEWNKDANGWKITHWEGIIDPDTLPGAP